MKYNRVLALILAFAILLGCTGLVPAYAATSGNDSDSSLSSQDSVTEQIQAPQYVDAEQFAQADHTERLYDEEKMNTYVYRNQDGSKSVYYMGQNVKYQHKDGTIRDKDTTLVRADRGYRMRDNDVDLHLPDSPADGITLAHGASSVKLLPQGGSGSARLSDNSILYAGCFGGKTILRYTPMLSGVKEDIILVSYTGQNSFAFVLETGGLYLYEAQGQYYLAESEAAEATFYLGQVVVYDAMGRPGNGSMTVETLISGQKYRLTLSADIDFLTDPETVYPVTVDPTLTVSYSVQGVNAIEDAPIYEGKPNSNYSNYVYDRVGYYDDEYKTARTVMRPAALLNSTEWQSIGSGDITSLKLYIKESSSKTAKQVNVHALTGNSTWTETNVKWSNVGAYSSTVYASASLGSGDWAEFNLTTLAKAWKNSTQNENCGILLKLADESVYRTFYACEYSTIDYRPYMVLDYKLDLALSQSSIEIDEGSSFALTIMPEIAVNDNLTWTSSNSTVASVSTNGIVTGHKLGTATITVTSADADHSATCQVLVTIADGVYQLQNVANSLYLDTRNGGTKPGTAIQQYTYATTHSRNQLYKITHLEDNIYSIRPMTNSGMGLYAVQSGGISLQTISTIDSAGEINSTQEWVISSNSNYTLRNNSTSGSAFLTASSSTTSGIQVFTGNYLSGYSDWKLIRYTGSRIDGVGLYTSTTQLECRERFDFDGYMYSSVIGCNGPLEYSVTNEDGSSTIKASINSSTGVLTTSKIGIITVRYTYEGANINGLVSISITSAGCRTYYEIIANSSESHSINCQGYAFGTNDTPLAWLADDYEDALNCATSNDALYGTDSFGGVMEALENNYLDSVFPNRWEKVQSITDGWDIQLDSNQWLVVFRVGKHGSFFDVHFWYRTNTGHWANKHGHEGSPSELLEDMPTYNMSSGWSDGVIYEFYDSDIIYYVITEEE